MAGTSSSPNINSFFKVMSSGHMKNISIPKAFLPQLNGVEHEKAILTTCIAGKSWDVRVGSHGNDKLCFKEGWDVFMKDHGLQLGDVLVFEHKGELRFDVLIFDSTACEREYPLLGAHKVVHEDVSHAQDVNVPIREKVIVKEEYEDEEEDDYGASTRGERANQKCRGSLKIRMAKKIPDATEAAKAYKPKSPYFMATIVASNLDKRFQYMNIPTEFGKVIEETDPTCNTITVRDSQGWMWSMKLAGRINRLQGLGKKRMSLENGWRQFSVDMKLKLGDTCVFEIDMEAKKEGIIILDVHIFPA